RQDLADPARRPGDLRRHPEPVPRGALPFAHHPAVRRAAGPRGGRDHAGGRDHGISAQDLPRLGRAVPSRVGADRARLQDPAQLPRAGARRGAGGGVRGSYEHGRFHAAAGAGASAGAEARSSAAQAGAPAGAVWVNGALVPPGEPVLAADDRGFTLGDGLFESMRAYGGRVFRLQARLERLRASADRLGIPVPPDLEDAVRATLAASGLDSAAVRLTVSRGPGGEGLALPEPA